MANRSYGQNRGPSTHPICTETHLVCGQGADGYRVGVQVGAAVLVHDGRAEYVAVAG